jgi:glycosyltransferase involved in cell wall biosynthesis
MKVVVVAHDIPYPPNEGGRLDIWNRLVALSRLDVSVHLITWSDESVGEDQLQQLSCCVDSATIHERDRSPHLALHPIYPAGIVSRRLSQKRYKVELDRLKLIRPDVILLDGLEGAHFATSVAQDLCLPLVYRSHNVEHQYLWNLFIAENKLIRKMLLLANVPRTKLVERRIRAFSSLVYDISYQDQAYWQKAQPAIRGKILYYCLHPDKDLACGNSEPSRDIDVLYIGNLHSPNNIYGLTWFARGVVPLLKNLRIVVAGSRPTPELLNILAKAGVDVLIDIEDAAALYDRAHVLVNPVWHSGGVNVKMIELLATGKVVVSTSAGTRGVSKELLRYVIIADDKKAFADAARTRIGARFSLAQQRDVMKEHSWENIMKLIADLKIITAGR